VPCPVSPALIAPLALIAVALITQRWEENRLQFPQRKAKPDNDNNRTRNFSMIEAQNCGDTIDRG
jgi:hypothetical protein